MAFIFPLRAKKFHFVAFEHIMQRYQAALAIDPAKLQVRNMDEEAFVSLLKYV